MHKVWIPFVVSPFRVFQSKHALCLARQEHPTKEDCFWAWISKNQFCARKRICPHLVLPLRHFSWKFCEENERKFLCNFVNKWLLATRLRQFSLQFPQKRRFYLLEYFLWNLTHDILSFGRTEPRLELPAWTFSVEVLQVSQTSRPDVNDFASRSWGQKEPLCGIGSSSQIFGLLELLFTQ